MNLATFQSGLRTLRALDRTHLPPRDSRLLETALATAEEIRRGLTSKPGLPEADIPVPKPGRDYGERRRRTRQADPPGPGHDRSDRSASQEDEPVTAISARFRSRPRSPTGMSRPSRRPRDRISQAPAPGAALQMPCGRPRGGPPSPAARPMNAKGRVGRCGGRDERRRASGPGYPCRRAGRGRSDQRSRGDPGQHPECGLAVDPHGGKPAGCYGDGRERCRRRGRASAPASTGGSGSLAPGWNRTRDDERGPPSGIAG